jgi:two-component system NtrC family sensor kinase
MARSIEEQEVAAGFRALIVDDVPSIHQDFNKILGRPTSVSGEIDDLEADLFADDARAGDDVCERLVFELDSAYQGTEGVLMVERAVAEGRPYALAFVDVRMPPGPDGIESLARMWEADPRMQAVVCSAHTDYRWDDIANKLGQRDSLLILRKPFDIVEVLQIAHALALKWQISEQVDRQLENLEALATERTRQLQHANENLRIEIERREQAQRQLELLSTHDAVTEGWQ